MALAGGTRQLQRVWDNAEAARLAAVEFAELSGQETEQITTVNDALAKFSRAQGALAQFQAHGEADPLILTARQEIQRINTRHAEIIGDYEGSEAEQRQAFINALFAELPVDFGRGQYEPEGLGDEPTYNAAWLGSLFDRLVARTVAASEEQAPYRRRYLAYALQSLADPLGANQIRHLLAVLGERQVRVAEGVQTDMSAGPVDVADNEKTIRTDDAGAGDDAGLLAQAEGNLYEYVRLKYGAEPARTANAQAAEVGNVQVNLDKNHYLFPIFAGISDETVVLFTTPKFVSVHHENGHLITMLEGKAGLGDDRKYKDALASLTSQEEAFNILGGRRSDRAYLESREQPVRFDHKSLITYIEGASDWRAWAGLVKDSYDKTYGAVPAMQSKLVQRLETILSASWSKVTSWAFTPTGVKEMRKKVTAAQTPLAKLQGAKAEAAKAAARVDKDRAVVTTNFYKTMADLDPTVWSSLKTAYDKLAAVDLTGQ